MSNNLNNLIIKTKKNSFKPGTEIKKLEKICVFDVVYAIILISFISLFYTITSKTENKNNKMTISCFISF